MSARKFFESALAEEKPSENLQLEAARFDFDTKHDDDATKLVKALLDANDHNSDAHQLLGELHLRHHRYDDALVEAKRAQAYGGRPEAALLIGNAYEALTKYAEALDAYGQAKKPPVVNEAALGRARAQVHIGATKDALDELRIVLTSNDCGAQARSVFARGRLLHGFATHRQGAAVV